MIMNEQSLKKNEKCQRLMYCLVLYINLTSKFHSDCLSIIGGTEPVIVTLKRGYFQLLPAR